MENSISFITFVNNLPPFGKETLKHIYDGLCFPLYFTGMRTQTTFGLYIKNINPNWKYKQTDQIIKCLSDKTFQKLDV